MSRTHYRTYKEQTLVLARTLIVKHEEIASAMNTELYHRGYVVDDNPYNWRYYLNLSGEYHIADNDELMERYGLPCVMVKVPSDAGPVEVPLTRELIHGSNANKAMMNEYQIGSRFYNELVSRYPDFENLIIGILNPIDIEVAIRAYDGEILFIAGQYKRISGKRHWFDNAWYSLNETLIEPQEDNLILGLQNYITTFLTHWHNPEYVRGNDLYLVTMLGILYSNIPNAIFNIRLGNCKTSRAHSFHIRSYLESNGNLGKYIDFIPTHTALWLYRNSHYLHANVGKQLTFNELVDKVLTPNQIPLSAYTARHELSGMGDGNLLPNGMLYKEVINFNVVGASDNDRTIRDILLDQIPQARGNAEDIDCAEKRIQERIDWGGDDRINTKVLESEMMELGEPYPFSLTSFLINHWGYTSARGFYNGSAYATNPITGDRLSFSAKNAYILAVYCLNKSVAGIELDHLPSPLFYNIPKTRELVHKPHDPSFTLKPDVNQIMLSCDGTKTRRQKVVEIMGTHVPNFYAADAEEFFTNTQEIYRERVRQYDVYSGVPEIIEHGDLKHVAKNLYWMGFSESLGDMSYEKWFRGIGFDAKEFTNEDLMSIGIELVSSAIGIKDEDTIRKRWLQKSLIAIMKHFVSYSVQFIEKFADGAVAYLEGQALRFSDFKWSYTEPLQSRYNVALSYHATVDVRVKVHIDVNSVFNNAVVNVKPSGQGYLDLSSFNISPYLQRIHVGTYALTASAYNIELNTEKSEPVHLMVTDALINTIMGISPYAQLHDTAARLHMPVVSSFFEHTPMYGHIRDVTVDARVNDNTLLMVGEMQGVSRSQSYADSSNNDNASVKLYGMSAALHDAPIATIHIVDDMTAINNYVTLSRHDGTQEMSNTNDKQAVDIRHLNATLVDAPVSIYHHDNSALIVIPEDIRYDDPLINTVTPPSDNPALDIKYVTGNQYDMSNATYAHDVSIFTTGQIEITLIDDAQAAIITHNDSMSISIGAISATYNDIAMTSIKQVNDTWLSLGTVSAVVIDSAGAIEVQDVHNLILRDVTAVHVDSGTVQTTDTVMVNPINISGNIIDSIPQVVEVQDATTLVLGELTATITDGTLTTKATDANSMVIGSINATLRDAPITTQMADDTAVIVNSVSARLLDAPRVSQTTDSNGIVAGNIVMSSRYAPIAVRINDDNMILTNLDGAKLAITEATITDTDTALVALDLANIMANVIDSP